MTAQGLLLRTALASGAMTASQRIEMAVTGRPPSDVPVRVVEAAIRRQVPGPTRAAVGHVAQAGLATTAVILASVTRRWTHVPAVAVTALCLVIGDAALATAVGVGDLPWQWRVRDLLTDALHKTVLAEVSRALAVSNVPGLANKITPPAAS